ncbi:MAG: GspE/PulE family protein [Planctomycetota bacterium]|jgi:type IV pilus assembly protein PilB|nr:GspE/PulE family protein [Planctomycetota bacterium]
MRKFLGELLVEMEVCTETEINDALQKQMAGDNRPIGEILVEGEACEPEHVARALAVQNDLRFVDLEALEVPQPVLDMIPLDLAKEHTVVPVAFRGRVLTVAMANPLDLGVIDSLRFTTNQQIEAAVASERQIIGALESWYGYSENKLDEMLGELTEGIEYRATGDDADGGGEDAPVIKYVQQIIQNAITMGASDIHIEPMSDRLRIRYRIDGVCINMDPAPKRLQGPVIQRIKIMSDGMLVEEKRRPQDGRIKVRLGEKRVDLRVSALPAVHGESVVMRILDQDSLRVSLGDMGFDPTDYKVFDDLIHRPNGIVLVTGPTGSGKTTTLYATLNELNTSDRKIITAEDPVEYHLNGINQCQVVAKIGFTFPRILRSMLRQAPNVIMIGEIRDLATAQIAIQSSLTGHLVFSTLHTNDAPSAITRLVDMGVAPFLVATSIQAVLAQRLIRTICPKCVQPFEADPKHLKALNISADQLEGRQLMRGAGCDACGGSGYKGRKGVFELMVMNNHLRDLAFDSAPTAEIRKAAIANGMHSLAMDGRRKALQGVTTPEEVLRVAKTDS